MEKLFFDIKVMFISHLLGMNISFSLDMRFNWLKIWHVLYYPEKNKHLSLTKQYLLDK